MTSSFVTECIARRPVVGPLTQQMLESMIDESTATQSEEVVSDIRIEIRYGDGFQLVINGHDEGFESDEDNKNNIAGVDDVRNLKTKKFSSSTSEDSSSSANSSGSETDESEKRETSADRDVIDVNDVLFCHIESSVPLCVAFVVRNKEMKLEAIVLKCPNETKAKELCKIYHEVNCKTKCDRYSNAAKRKQNISRTSLTNVGKAIRSRFRHASFEQPSSGDVSKTSIPQGSDERFAQSGAGDFMSLEPEKVSNSLPYNASCILSLNAPEPQNNDRESRTSHSTQRERQGIRRNEAERRRLKQRPWSQPLFNEFPVVDEFNASHRLYDHRNAKQSKIPTMLGQKRHPTNPNLLLVPTKNGYDPYHPIYPKEQFALRSLVPVNVEYLRRPAWTNSQFDVNNNNKNRLLLRHQVYWMTPQEMQSACRHWNSELAKVQGRTVAKANPSSKNSFKTNFEFSTHVTQMFKDAVTQLKKTANKNTANELDGEPPRSVMKKKGKNCPDTKHVTFSDYSTVQVMK